jgi:hypothetical protein
MTRNEYMIHWEAHGQALNKNFIHRTFPAKLIHGMLPVGKIPMTINVPPVRKNTKIKLISYVAPILSELHGN